ncbi:MAG: GNAT family N-acetyltransferase [Chloroflexota bacterium]|nr:GNAT family N-acetyltransferase [Chloroflexota bacterium]MDQ5866605.1 GNAT family N-acetyltransferase [Chloroflexota bacterium]
MAQDTLTEEDIPQDLDDGLVMRKARPEDREALADFHANNLLDIGETGPNEGLHAWMLDLMSGEHPTFRPGDFVLVEDTNAGKIVSSMGLISQTWTYEGIPFKFGQPEIVSTDPTYRRRGLVRAQFNEVHRWSALRGEMVQGITGIPWYYRQFGYEMAINLGGARSGFRPHVPRLKDGEAEPYRFRRAAREDVPFILEMYQQATSRSMLASIRDEALWRYDIEGRSEKSDFRVELRVIETPEGEPVGALAHSWKLRASRLGSLLYEVKPGVSLLAVTDSVLRYLYATGEEYAKRDGEEFEAFGFSLGEQHPVYDTIPERLPRIRKPYAWYIRVPDVPAFVKHITPALEKRLAGSPQSGYTGELKINFYRSGLLLKFQQGSISVGEWKPDRVEEGDAAFPDLTFLQLLFGYRSLEELQHAFPDCSTNTATGSALLPILFPKRVSNVWAGG